MMGLIKAAKCSLKCLDLTSVTRHGRGDRLLPRLRRRVAIWANGRPSAKHGFAECRHASQSIHATNSSNLSNLRHLQNGKFCLVFKERRMHEIPIDRMFGAPAATAHEQRVAQIADVVRRIPCVEGRANAARALRKLESDPDAVRALIDLLAIASSPPLRRLTGRYNKVGLLPGEALGRLKDDLADATNLEPVVVYAADLRTLIELVER